MFCDGLALGVVEYQISTLWNENERQLLEREVIWTVHARGTIII